MKYIVPLFLLLMPFSCVYAAKQVSGQMPQVQPLLPAPVGITPNVSNNIQFSDPSHATSTAGTSDPLNSSPTDQPQAEEPSQINGQQQSAALVVKKPSFWPLLVIIILALVGGAVAWLKVGRHE